MTNWEHLTDQVTKNCVNLVHKLLLEKTFKGKIMTNSLSNLLIISPTDALNTNTHIRKH